VPDDHRTVSVTSAGLSATEDRRLRQRRYAITQVVRIVCFLLAVMLPVPMWARLLLILAAFTLPWIGVITANAGPMVHKPRTTAAVAPVVRAPVALDPSRVIDQD